uniref:Uncharacterized protein n=1 Tax=Esox lucius TaxID=8010 RepID=A0A6Q2XXN4_ESOLU
IPGTFPTRLNTILSRAFPVRTFTALLMVMPSKLIPFTSTSWSPTHRPACSGGERPRSKHTLTETYRTAQPGLNVCIC